MIETWRRWRGGGDGEVAARRGDGVTDQRDGGFAKVGGGVDGKEQVTGG